MVNMESCIASNKYRTHHCEQLRKKNVGDEVILSGWIRRRRDHGGVFFIDLCDHYGVIQVVTSQEDERIKFLDKKQYDEFVHLPYETVITVHGNVVARSDDTINKQLATGEVEVVVKRFEVESLAEVLPLTVNSDQPFPDDIRLRYRFLDLRREKMHHNIMLRSEIIRHIRDLMHEQGFLDLQTPILTASSPEGARDFLVPSRLHHGKFYALPQAPQQFKQLLMTSGFDKYFQIAPCFRDEDARADRAPGEFYQLDIEMAFVTQEDVFAMVEPVLYSTFKKFTNKQVTEHPFPRIKYADAMLKYGSDKPDLRNPIEISDVTDIFRTSEFSIFVKAIAAGSVIRAIPAPKTASQPRSFFDKMIEFAQKELGAGGLAYIIFDEEGNAKSPIAKFLSAEQLSELKKVANLQNGDSVFFACDKESAAANIAGKVRDKLGHDLNLIEQDIFKFCWIIDFPFYEWDEENKKIDFSHNPFSMPQGGLEALDKASASKEQLLQLKAYQYDIVCNGIELSSGAIRNHKPEIMYRAFELAGYTKADVEERFGALLRAFKYGAPPHGGIAPGIDRIVMLVADEPNIREVICFPFNQNAQDLLMNAPAEVDEKQLRELGLQLRNKGKKAVNS